MEMPTSTPSNTTTTPTLSIPTTTTPEPSQETTTTQTPKPITIETIRLDKNLWYKLHVFTFDLHSYSSNTSSRTRLELVTSPSYLGLPYFNSSEVTLLKDLIVPPEKSKWLPKNQQKGGEEAEEGEKKTLGKLIEETLKERLERRVKKREESGDFRVCAAHDLTPVFERGFGVEGKVVVRDGEFLKVVEEWGLDIEGVEGWSGVKVKGGNKGRR